MSKHCKMGKGRSVVGWLLTVFLYGWPTLIRSESTSGLQRFQQRVVVNASELCVIPITPSQLGWEKQPGSMKEIEYSARMSNSPDLPEWLKYSYDGYTSSGYIYGVPPLRLVTLNLDVIGWNRYVNYDARKLVVSLEIMRKEPMDHIVEMKIDNLNIRDLCLPRKMNELKTILAEHLGWTQKNGNRVVPVYMASAVDIGENRVPLRPNEAEGVVIHFSSDKDFSQALKKLQVEISPLWRLRPCPRDMKRTSVERHFRRYNFLVDWCSFRLVSKNGMEGGTESTVGSQKPSLSNSEGSSSGSQDLTDETSDFVNGQGKFAILPEVFQFTSSIPDRSYGYEALLSTIIPGSIGGLIGVVLIALLWADREDESVDGDRLFFEAAFRMIFSMIRYGNGNGTTTYAYHQITRQQHHQEDSNSRLTREVTFKAEPEIPAMHGAVPSLASAGPGSMMVEDELMAAPIMPPQYSETHPNGAPAMIYAV